MLEDKKKIQTVYADKNAICTEIYMGPLAIRKGSCRAENGLI